MSEECQQQQYDFAKGKHGMNLILSMYFGSKIFPQCLAARSKQVIQQGIKVLFAFLRAATKRIFLQTKKEQNAQIDFKGTQKIVNIEKPFIYLKKDISKKAGSTRMYISLKKNIVKKNNYWQIYVHLFDDFFFQPLIPNWPCMH